MSPESVTIPASVPLLASVITRFGEHPALSPVSVGTLIELPCCGSRVDVEAIRLLRGRTEPGLLAAALDVSRVPHNVQSKPRWLRLD